METFFSRPGGNGVPEQKWTIMIVLAMVLHAAVFSSVFFVPENPPKRRMRDVVYEVNLVDMPVKGQKGRNDTARSTRKKAMVGPAKRVSTKRIGQSKMGEKAVVISKRTVDLKAEKVQPTAPSASRILENPVPKVERPLERKDGKGMVEKEGPSEKHGQFPAAGPRPGIRSASSISMDLYRSDIKDIIQSHWSYVSTWAGAGDGSELSAVVILLIEQNGTILRTTMTKYSGNAKYDQSVINAIKKTGKLPALPQGYRKSQEEIEIHFNISELKNQ